MTAVEAIVQYAQANFSDFGIADYILKQRRPLFESLSHPETHSGRWEVYHAFSKQYSLENILIIEFNESLEKQARLSIMEETRLVELPYDVGEGLWNYVCKKESLYPEIYKTLKELVDIYLADRK